MLFSVGVYGRTFEVTIFTTSLAECLTSLNVCCQACCSVALLTPPTTAPTTTPVAIKPPT